MAFVDVGLALGASEAFAGIVGTAAVGAGAGAAYSAITGDGNVLNSALTGAAIGGTLGAMAPAGGFSAATASAPSTLAAPTSNVLTTVPGAVNSGSAAFGSVGGASVPSVGYDASASILNPGTAANIPGNVAGAQSIAPSIAEFDAAGYGGTSNGVLNQVPGTAPYNPAPFTGGEKIAAGLTGGQKLAAGLAGAAALSLIGGQNQKRVSTNTVGTQNQAMIRPYTYSQTKNPNYGQPGQPYYVQGYTAQTPYNAAAGGLMGTNGSFLSQDEQSMYPQSQMDKTQYAVSSQMPTSAEVVDSDYEPKTNSYTGLPMARFADGGQTGLPAQPNAQAGLPLQQNVQAPLDVAINPQTDQRQIVAPIQLPTAAYTPQAVPDAGRFQNAFNQYQYESNIAPKPSPTAQVLDYSRILNQRANDEYVNSPTPAAFKAAPPPPPPPSPEVQAAERAKTIAALPHNQSTFNADAYLAANPDVAAQIGKPGVESAWAHYMNYGQKEGRNAAFDVIPPTPAPSSYITNPNAAAAGLPQYTYNPATKSFGRATPAPPSSAQTPQQQFEELMAAYQNKQPSYDSSLGGGAGGGLMPRSLKYASGGATEYNLGGYSDGGRLLKGPGDGMSDNIPASIGDKQPARLADGEFVVPADVVSHLGNGSTDAGAKKLYAMMDKIRQARTGHTKQGKQIKAEKYLKA